MLAALLLLASPDGASARDVCADPLPRPCSEDPPVADFVFSPSNNVERRTTLTVTSTSTANPDRELEDYFWDLDSDGDTDVHGSPEARLYAGVPGTQTVTLTVRDDEGDSAVVAKTFTVSDPPAPEPPQDPAVTYQQNLLHSGFVDEESPTTPLTRRWDRNFGEMARVSYALVADNRVFVTTDENDRDRFLYALDPESGATIWRRSVAATEAPAYDNGRVVVIADGLLKTFDAATGNEISSTSLGSWSVGSPPVAFAGLVHTTMSGIGAAVRTLDTGTGRTVWSQGISGSFGSIPAVDGNDLYVSYPCGGTYKMDRLTGYPQWWSRTACSGGSVGSTPVVHRGRVYARDQRIRSGVTEDTILDASTGDRLGAFAADFSPVFKEEIGVFPLEHEIEAKNVESGESLWKFQLPDGLGASPVIAGDVLFLMDSEARVHALDLASGETLWSDRAGGSEFPYGNFSNISQGLAFGEGQLYVPTPDGHLVAYGERQASSAPPVDQPGPGAADLVAQLPPVSQEPGVFSSYQGNTAHDGFINSASPVPPLEPAWSVGTPEVEGVPSNDWIPTQPLAADGLVFMAVRTGTPFELKVVAVDPSSGEPAWTIVLDEESPIRRAWLAYSAGTLFILDGYGALRAVDASTGTTDWQTQVPGEPEDPMSPPVADDNSVYVVGSGGTMFAFDAETGQQQWLAGSGGNGESMAALGDERAYFSFVCNHWGAIGLEDGERSWNGHGGCTGGGGSTAVYADGRVWVRQETTGFVLDAATGEILDGFNSDLPAIAGNIAIMHTKRTLRAESVETGEILWDVRQPPNLRYAVAPLVVGRHVYVVRQPEDDRAVGRPRLMALDLSSGEESWGSWLERDVPAVDPGDTNQYGGPSGLVAGSGIVLVPDSSGYVAYTPRLGPSEPVDTSIESGPDGPTADDTPTFEYRSNLRDVYFECRRNTGSWKECGHRSTTLQGLSDGVHTFAVRAVDSADRADPTPATRSFTVDTVAPGSAISGGPDGRTRNRRPTFEFTASETGVTFECSLDSGAYSRCSTPYRTKRLSMGRHVLAVRAVDAASNTGAPTERTVRVVRRKR